MPEEIPVARTWSSLSSSHWKCLQSDWCRVFLLVLVAFVIHSPALSGQLIWDDSFLAHDNPFIKSPLFVFEAFRHHLFLDSFSAHYRPVQNLSFIADYYFWTEDTYGFHLTNIGLHAACGVALYFLLGRLLQPLSAEKLTDAVRSGGAFLVALLWAVHPVHSAAVDYISGRADSLAFLFASSAWLLYLRAAEKEWRWLRTTLFLAAAFSALLALCSRETAGLWMVIFLLHTLVFSRGLTRAGKVRLLVSGLALCALYAGLRQLPERRAGRGPTPEWSVSMRAVLMLRALGDYGRLMIFPVNLHMERTVVDMTNYESHASWQRSVGTEYLSIGGVILGGLLPFGCRRRGPAREARIFGTCWFVIGFLPISNLFDLNATVAEHWLYLPSVGLLIFIAGCALDLPPRYRGVLATGACVAALALSLRSTARSGDWTTAEHFYRQTIAAGGASTRVSLNLGQLYAARGEYARAEACFRSILAGFSNYSIAQTNLANALFHEGKKAEAEALFAAATAAAPNERNEFPRTWIAVLNLAGLREQHHDLSGVLALLDQARADYPRIWELVSFESEVLRKNRGPAAAIPLVEKYRRENWWNYAAALALGQLYAQNGETAKAEAALHDASWLDVHEVAALNLLADIRVRQNRLPEACAVQKRAVARQPNLPREYVYLSRILEKMGRTAEANAAIATVTQLRTAAREFGPVAAN